MTLGIFLSIGDSLTDMKKTGQNDRFINTYLKKYSKNFEKVYLFSYEKEKFVLPNNIILISNKNKIHRYIYCLILPLLNKEHVNKCDIIRGFGLTSFLPSIFVTKPFFSKKIPLVFNWPYDYWEFLKLENRWLLAFVYKLLEILAFAKASVVFVATKDKMKKINGSKFVYLPNGVDTSIFKSQSKKFKTLIYLGRFEYQKNLFFLIKAVSKMHTKLRYITFVGAGNLEERLKKFAHENKVNLTIIPPIKNRDLPKILSEHKILTLTSYVEGSPKALIEAMACGLAPVVTSFKTAKEVVKNAQNGFITKYNVTLYSKKLSFLLSSEQLRKKISQNAVETISNNFDLEKLLKREIHILKTIKIDD